jgi:CRP/FNR family transcriptional regulator
MAVTTSHCEISGCAQCPARANSIFSDLNGSDVNTVSTSKGSRSYQRGEIIFYAGNRPTGLYCIHQGRVKLYKMGNDGREQIIRLAGAGDVIGYRSLLSGESYGLYAEALEPVRICHIPKSVFSSLLEQSYDLSGQVMRLLASDLRTAEEKIVDMALKPVSERVAETLLMLRDTYGVMQDEMTINMRLTRFDLANYVGAATESVSRQLSKFKGDGIIELVGRKIRIMDHRALVDAANLGD